MEGDDPWFWDTERVVKEFCTSTRTWPDYGPGQRLPDPVTFAAILKDNSITGNVLLNDLYDDAILREEFSLRNFNTRSTIKHAIRFLRTQSNAYTAYHEGAPIQSDAKRLCTALDHTNQHLDVKAEDFAIPAVIPDTSIEPIESENDVVQVDEIVPDRGTKRKRATLQFLGPVEVAQGLRTLPTEADTVIEYAPDVPQPGQIVMTDNGKKRMLPYSSQPPGLTKNIVDRLREDSQLQAGGEQGRIAAQLLLDNKAKAESNNAVSQPLDSGYLGKHKMSVDHIFYGPTPLGSQINVDITPDNIADTLSEISYVSAGRCIYVNQMMKSFLCMESTFIDREDQSVLARRAYQTRFAPQRQSPSIILIHQEDGNLVATREELSKWPEIDLDATTKSSSKVLADDSRLNTFQMPGAGPLELVSQLSTYADGWDESVLEKYRYADGADEVLPLFGDSDSENDYDFDTWQEIERENPGTEKELVSKSKRQPLSEDEVKQAIDEGVAALIQKWHEEKRYKGEVRAYKQWHQCRKEGTRKQELSRHRGHLERLNGDRLVKLTKEIMGEQWTRPAHVHQQTKCMEQSIFDREEAALLVQVLDSKKPPLKPAENERQKALASQKAKREQEVHQDDEDGESLGSDSDVPSIDELDDFIVSDGPDDGLVSMPDMDEESASMDVGSTPELSDSDESVVIPTPRRHRTPLKNRETPEASTMEIDEQPDLPPIKDEFRKSQSDFGAQRPYTDPNVINLISSDNDNSPSPPVLVLDATPVKRSFTDPRRFDAVQSVKSTPTPSSTREERFTKAINATECPLDLRDLLSECLMSQVWQTMLEVLESICKTSAAPKGVDSATLSIYKQLITLFGHYIMDTTNVTVDSALLQLFKVHGNSWSAFYKTCQSLLEDIPLANSQRPRNGRHARLSDDNSDTESSDEGSSPLSSSSRARGEQPRLGKGLKLRKKKKIIENVEARDEREETRRRRAEQDQRRKLLHAKQTQLSGDMNADGIIVNDAAKETDSLVYVDPYIATRIVEHQVDGVRFIWSQIIEGDKGCLLAHTMGLGKTMQVVTFLVAVNEASNKPEARELIPERLRNPRVLILCPPTLIDNWMDELCQWAPDGSMGELRKIDSAIKGHATRFQELKRWHKDRGVLVMGYEMFRDFVLKDTDNHDKIKEYLLDGPSLVIADEAHKMKNKDAKIAQAAKKIKTASRIALTGSPLSNHVLEYHAMIEWVSPNYLGPETEFKAKYADPIERGNYRDSTGADRSRAKKMLKVLMREVEPKVQRRDTSVLRGRLPPKLEFVLTVPLTPLQEQAYNLYVEAMFATDYDQNKDGQVTNTTLWSWLAVLSLLCNHPHCFERKLKESRAKVEKEKARRALVDVDLDGDSIIPIIDPELRIPDTLAEEMNALFASVPDLASATLSNKVAVLQQILDESKAAGDKVLIFSMSLPTLDYLEQLCLETHRTYARLDGKTKMSQRQSDTKAFNTSNTDLYLISTTAGGLGLNLQAANRVVIFDFTWTPTSEEQAIGRAYRLGQSKSVFVYRFLAGGTFETKKHMVSVFKTQLASKVVDKKNPMNWARRMDSSYLTKVKPVEQEDLSPCLGRDPQVFDKLVAAETARAADAKLIRKVELTTIFEDEDDLILTAEEEADAERMITLEALKRADPAKYDQEVAAYQRQLFASEVQRINEANAQAAANAQIANEANQQAAARARADQVATTALQQAKAKLIATTRLNQNGGTSSSPHTIVHQQTAARSDVILPPNASTNTPIPLSTRGGQEPIMAGGTGVYKGRPAQPTKSALTNPISKVPVTPAKVVEIADDVIDEPSLFVSSDEKPREKLTMNTIKRTPHSSKQGNGNSSTRILPPGGNDGARSPRPGARSPRPYSIHQKTNKTLHSEPRTMSSRPLGFSSTQPQPRSSGPPSSPYKLNPGLRRKLEERRDRRLAAEHDRRNASPLLPVGTGTTQLRRRSNIAPISTASGLPSWAQGEIEREQSMAPEARAARDARRARAGSSLPSSSAPPARSFQKGETIEID